MRKYASIAVCLMMVTQARASEEDRQLRELMTAVKTLSKQIAQLQQQLAALTARPRFLHGSRSHLARAVPGSNICSLESIIVNLRGDGARRLLKCDIHLRLSSPEIAETLNTPINAIRVRDSLITLLSARAVEAIQGAEGKTTLRTEIRNHLNRLLKLDGGIEEVRFTEFMVQ